MNLVLMLALLQTADAAAEMERLYQSAAKRAAAWTVAIRVEREPEPTPGTPSRRNVNVFSKRPEKAWCSGTIIEPEGTIVTTYFNVSGKVKSIEVLLPGGRTVKGKLLGYDGKWDLAAIKVEAGTLPRPVPAPLEILRTGMPVMALGRAPDGRGLTAAPGIVSSPSSHAGRTIQTDAKLNFGNIGGPLVDLQGRLIGVTCQVNTKSADVWGQNSGVGFAVLNRRLSEILPGLKKGEKVEEARRAFLGVSRDPQSTTDGAKLLGVVAGSAAEKAGLRPNDVIVEMDGQKVQNFDQLRAIILRHAPGDRIKVKILRAKKTLELEVELGWAPD